MNLKRYIKICGTLLVLLTGTLTANAQSHRINGRLVDHQEKPIGYAGVTLYKADSVHISTVMTDSAGYFSVSSLPRGKYWVKASYIGYQNFKSPLFELNESSPMYAFGNIKLPEDSRSLSTVQITKSRPLIEQRSDRIVMNVENSVLSTGSSALELLGKAPGVTVDDNGGVSLKGRPGTAVMINGKLTYLSGSQLVNLLKGTSSSTVSKIEIMSNPSSKFDAAGKGGIINIVMKTNVKTGFNGTVSADGGSGRGARLGGGTSLNYRSEKVNLFGSYNYFYQNLKSYNDNNREFYQTNAAHEQLVNRSSFQQTTETAKLRSQNFRAGMDIFFDEKNTLGFLINGGIGKYPALQNTQNRLYGQPENSLMQDARTLTDSKEKWEDMLYNVNYIHRFNDKGHELTLDLDYVSHYSKMDQQLDTRYLNETGGILRNPSSRVGDVPSYNNIYVAKLDYALPLGNKGKLEAGWKGSDVRTENKLQYDTLRNGIYIDDLSTSNHFKYTEQIQAAYVNAKQVFGKFSVQVGLRGEHTTTKGHQLITDSVVKRSYFKLFPSVILNQEITENHKFQAGYSKRIERPSYWDLNPFRVYDDPFSYEEGNPYLKPAIVDAFELGYSFLSKYHTVFTYNRTNNVISSVTGVLENQNITFLKPENLATFVNYGVSLTASTDFTSWWSGTQFVNLFHNDFKIDGKNGVSETIKGTTLTFDSQHTFKLNQGWKAELNGAYRTAEISGIFKTKAYYMVSAGAKKELMDGKASIGVRVNDIFQSRKFKQTASFGGINTNSYLRPDSRSAVLSFSYRFGGDSAAARIRSTGSEDLKGRMK